MKMTSATVLSRSGRVLAVGAETGAGLGAESDGAGSGAPEAVGVCWDRDVREVLMAGSVGAAGLRAASPRRLSLGAPLRPWFVRLRFDSS